MDEEDIANTLANMPLNTGEVNYLIWRYLLESGYENSAFIFAGESQLATTNFLPSEQHLPSGALAKLLLRGSLYTQMHDPMQEGYMGLIEAASKKLNVSEAGVLTRCRNRKSASYPFKKPRNPMPMRIIIDDKEVYPDELFLPAMKVAILDGHEPRLWNCAWHPRENLLLSTATSQEENVRIWTLNTNTKNWKNPSELLLNSTPLNVRENNVKRFNNDLIPKYVFGAWSNNEEIVMSTVTMGGSITIWSKSGKNLMESNLDDTNEHAIALQWSPVGEKNFMAIATNMRHLYVYDMSEPDNWFQPDRQIRYTLPHDITTINFVNLDYGLILLGSGQYVVLCDLAKTSPIQYFDAHEGIVTQIACAPNSNVFATASNDKSVKVWKLNCPQPLRSFDDHLGSIVAIDWHPSCRFIATSCTDGALRVFDVDKDVVLAVKWERPSHAFKFSPDGEFLAAGLLDGRIFIWDTINFEIVHIYKEKGMRKCCELMWKRDAPILSAGFDDGTIRILDIRS